MYATILQNVRDAIATLNDAPNHEEVAELIDRESELKPEVLGQLLMNALRDPEDPMNRGDKLYWLAVAEHMGPDWLSRLRHVAAFMTKFEEF